MRLRPLPVIAALIAAVGLITLLFTTISHVRYSSDGAVRRYISEHKDDVAIACFDPADAARGLLHNAEVPFPLASTFKLALLAAYADAVARGSLTADEAIALGDVEKYYLPGTDGDAHSQFLASLEAGTQTVTLDDVVAGMLIYGSNAAADYLASRLEPDEVAELYQRLELQETELPFSYLGLYLFMTNHETGEYAQEELSLQEVRAEQNRLETLFINDLDWRAQEIAYLRNQANFAPVQIQKEVLDRYGMAGSARDLSRILLAAYGYTDVLPLPAQEVMRRHLEWPLRVDPANAQEFDILAAQSGAWPGILTSAWYADGIGDSGPLVLVVLYRHMPDDFWNAWLVGFSHQLFESRALVSGDCSAFSDALN